MTDMVEDHSHQNHEHYVIQVFLIVEIHQQVMTKLKKIMLILLVNFILFTYIDNIVRKCAIEHKNLDDQFLKFVH